MTSKFSISIDELTLRRAQGDDRAAQERIYRAFERAAYGLARRLTEQVADAEEVMQNAFVRAFRNLKQFRAESDLGFWLRRIVINEALAWKRQQRDSVGEVSDALSRSDVRRVVHDHHIDLQNGLEQLQQPTKGVLWLFYVEGFNHEEIASMYGQSSSFSKSQVARGTARLRALLNPEPELMLSQST
jgi:RNA polymerase sigma-70 factor (ECF subfamily)